MTPLRILIGCERSGVLRQAFFEWVQAGGRNAKIRKLGEEFGELAEALAEYIAAANCSDGEFEARKQALKDEAGDMGIVLADFCILVGFSLDDAMRQKLAKTKAREAEKPR